MIELSCDELWDVVHTSLASSSSPPPSSSFNGNGNGNGNGDGDEIEIEIEFISPSSNLRDWTGYLIKGEWVGEQDGTGIGMVYKAQWKDVDTSGLGRRKVILPVFVAKILKAEVVRRDYERDRNRTSKASYGLSSCLHSWCTDGNL